MRTIVASFALLAAFAATPAQAQPSTCAANADNITKVVADPDGPVRERAITELADIQATPRCFARALLARLTPESRGYRTLLKQVEAFRSDKQGGATNASTGSTSIVAQGATARVLSAAAEYGALTQSAKDGVVTVRGNLAGLPSALVSHDVFPYCVETDTVSSFCVGRSALSILRRFSFGVSFDPSRTETLAAKPAPGGTAATKEVRFTASDREIAGYSFRGEIWNHRDTTSEKFKKDWKEKVGKALDEQSGELLAAGEFLVDIVELDAYDAWRTRARTAIVAAGRDRGRIESALAAAYNELAVEVEKLEGFPLRVMAVSGAYSRLFLGQDALIDTLATASVLAIEYTRTIPAAQPRTQNVRLIYDQPFSNKTKLVANLAVTAYDEVIDPAAGGRLRDAQAGVQLDRGLGTTAIGAAVFSVAGYFQYQRAASILKVDAAQPLPGVTFTGLPEGAKQVFTKTGNIWLAQAKVSLTPAGKSVTVPLSITYSNRTELVDNPTWRGQVGVSYNVDALFAGLAR